jgi:sigma-B regulation protein RsbU (phosphoserine phosphatase)
LSEAGDLSADDLEDLFEHAPCGYLSTDKDGRILRANQTFAQWTGFASATLVGRRFADLLPIVGKIFYETHCAPMLHMQGGFSEIALDITRADGVKMPTLVNAVERKGEGARPTFFRFTIFNATERRMYEGDLLAARDIAQAAAKAEQDTAILREQFIAVLGHDLRNPLAAIASGIRLLAKEQVSERGKTVITLMEGSVVRALGLIDNVRDFAQGRLGGGLTLVRNAEQPLEPVLRQVVSELCSIAPDRVVTADYRLDEPVDCDRGRIGQLLSNLLGNALTHGVRDQPVLLSAVTQDGWLDISVTNGGAPITAPAMERLFQPFFRGEIRLNPEGLGLGLHIASEIAKAHGGDLTVTSDDAATCFRFRMPLVV